MLEAPKRDRSTDDVTRFVAALCVALLVFNSVTHLLPGHSILYVPMNLAAAAALLLASRRFGLGWAELGLAPSHWRSGVVVGASVAVVAGAALLLASRVPAAQPLLDDARLAGIGPGLVAYRTLVRVPLGTALLEEVAFRGVLFGAWMRLTSPQAAAVGSSIVFGLWHIRPTIDLLDANDLAAGGVMRTGLILAAIASTAIAGYVFCMLRLRSQSVLAPLIAHAAINSFAILAAFSAA